MCKKSNLQSTLIHSYTLHFYLTVGTAANVDPVLVSVRPLSPLPQANHSLDFDTGSALVLTIESTLITACSSESLVSKGHFKNFCLRFAEGFERTWDDWKPEVRGELVMNACEPPAPRSSHLQGARCVYTQHSPIRHVRLLLAD